LLNALYAYKGSIKSRRTLAEEACKIEIEILGEPIGKQDQYIAAFGGIQHIQFNPDEGVYVDPVICPIEVKRELESNLLLFYTGITRKSSTILKEQSKKTKDKMESLHKMKVLSEEVRDSINRHDVDNVGKILHQGWLFKRELASGITNPEIDNYYQSAIDAGAIGGKILGAGGGGFILVYCKKKVQDKVRAALSDLTEVKFKIEPQGSKIIYVEDRND